MIFSAMRRMVPPPRHGPYYLRRQQPSTRTAGVAGATAMAAVACGVIGFALLANNVPGTVIWGFILLAAAATAAAVCIVLLMEAGRPARRPLATPRVSIGPSGLPPATDAESRSRPTSAL